MWAWTDDDIMDKWLMIFLVLFADAVVLVSVIILVGLFSIQQFGTSKVGFTFAPALALWFFCLGSIGIYNIYKYDITVLRAFNPAYVYLFFKKNSTQAWSALGGCVLCITGMSSFSPCMLQLYWKYWGKKEVERGYMSNIYWMLLLVVVDLHVFLN